jgi:hypothetical protein
MNSISILLLGIVFFAGWQGKKLTETNDDKYVSEQIEHITQKYEDLAYRGFFSVDDLKPFSILQFEQTVNKYSGDWQKAENYTELLDRNKLKKLKKEIVSFISEDEDKDKILNKLKYWCVSSRQIDVLKNDFDIAVGDLLSIFYRNESTNSAFNILSIGGSFDPSKLTEIQTERLLNSCMNKIAEMSKKEQFKINSYVYAKLAEKI